MLTSLCIGLHFPLSDRVYSANW